MVIALPLSCCYLPLVVVVKDAERRRTWVLLVAGGDTEPAVVASMAVISQWRGSDVNTIWNGDPLTGMGAGLVMIFTVVGGFITATINVIALKQFAGRSRELPIGMSNGICRSFSIEQPVQLIIHPA